MKYNPFLITLVVLTAHAAGPVQGTDLYVQAKTVTESGSTLASGSYNVVVNAESKRTNPPSTQGNTSEPEDKPEQRLISLLQWTEIC